MFDFIYDIQKCPVQQTNPSSFFIMSKTLTQNKGTPCIVSLKRSSGNFTFCSQTQSDKTFPKYISRLPSCANPPCVRSQWGKELFSAEAHKVTQPYCKGDWWIGSSRVSVQSETSFHEGHCHLSVSLTKRPARQS